MVIYPLDSAIQCLNNRGQALVVEKVDNTINTIHWMVIYQLNSAIQCLNNWGQVPVVGKVDNTIHCMDKSLSNGQHNWFP